MLFCLKFRVHFALFYITIRNSILCIFLPVFAAFFIFATPEVPSSSLFLRCFSFFRSFLSFPHPHHFYFPNFIFTSSTWCSSQQSGFNLLYLPLNLIFSIFLSFLLSCLLSCLVGLVFIILHFSSFNSFFFSLLYYPSITFSSLTILFPQFSSHLISSHLISSLLFFSLLPSSLFRCPRAFHLNCIPPGARFSGATSCVVCPEHPLDPMPDRDVTRYIVHRLLFSSLYLLLLSMLLLLFHSFLFFLLVLTLLHFTFPFLHLFLSSSTTPPLPLIFHSSFTYPPLLSLFQPYYRLSKTKAGGCAILEMWDQVISLAIES
jgi:hypothetical protein